MASREFGVQSSSYEYGLAGSGSKQLFTSEFEHKYDRQAYVAPSSEKEQRDEIDLDELNELLGLNAQGPSKIDQLVNQLKSDSHQSQPQVTNPYAKRSYF